MVLNATDKQNVLQRMCSSVAAYDRQIDISSVILSLGCALIGNRRTAGAVIFERANDSLVELVRFNLRASNVRTRGLSHWNQVHPRDHLITLSALASTLGGIVKPICFAVFKLMTNSNLIGCSIGRSAGFVPFRILST